MKINSFKILYSTTIPIQSYGVNDKVAVEIEIVPDESKSPNEQFDLEAIIGDHKKNVDAIVAKLYPNIYNKPIGNSFEQPIYYMPKGEGNLSEIKVDYLPEERRIGDIVNDIRSCTDLRILETYRFIAKSKPEFQEAYDEMFNKLSNQK